MPLFESKMERFEEKNKNRYYLNVLVEVVGIIIVCFLLWFVATKNLEPFTELYFNNESINLIERIPNNPSLFDDIQKISFVVVNFENKKVEYVCNLSMELFKDNKLTKINITKTKFSLKDKEKRIFIEELDVPKEYDYIKVSAELIFENKSQEIYFWIHNKNYYNTFRERVYLAEWNFFEYNPDFYLNASLLPKKIQLNKRIPIHFIIKDNGEGGNYEYDVRRTVYFMNNKIEDRLNYGTLILEKNEERVVHENLSLQQGTYPTEIKILLIHEDVLKELNFSLNITSIVEEKLRVISYNISKNKLKVGEWFDVEMEMEIFKEGDYESKIVFIDESGQEVGFKQEAYSQEPMNSRIKEKSSLRSYGNTKPGKYEVFLTFFDKENQLENLLEDKKLYLGDIVIENGK